MTAVSRLTKAFLFVSELEALISPKLNVQTPKDLVMFNLEPSFILKLGTGSTQNREMPNPSAPISKVFALNKLMLICQNKTFCLS